LGQKQKEEVPMKVTNIDGTRDNTCKCDSWLAHWEKFNPAGQTVPTYCPAMSCINKPEVGAHVQKHSSSDKSWYIIPLCSKCNAKTGKSLEVSDSISLASANVSETCGKE
jgi:hypothetical protein